MKKKLIKIGLLSLIVSFGGCKMEPKVTLKQPNFVFIIADDMYPEMFNTLSKNTNLTPALDRLAKEGVWLENMKVVSPVCTPSRYNILTGNYASRATNRASINSAKKNEGQKVIQWNSFIVQGQDKTMGTYFQNLGYQTGFVGKNHIIESTAQIGEKAIPELDADINDPKVKEGLAYRYKELQKDIKNCGFDFADGLYHNNPNWLGIKKLASHNMDWIAEKGLEFIEINKDCPFMLYFATTLPHGPLNPEQSWKADRKITPSGRLKDAPDVLPKFKGVLEDEDRKLVNTYPGMEPTVRNYLSIEKRIAQGKKTGRQKENLLWLDDAINALFNKLEDAKVLDNTVIVFFNDHGQTMKGTLYEGGVNSQAMIWKKGGFEVGKTLHAPVSNVDFLPTLLELAGDSKSLNDFDGYSFKAALNNENYVERTSMYHELGYARALVKDGFKYYAVRYPKWAVNLTLEQRQKMLDRHNNFKRKYNRPILTADPMAPFGQLVMIPGGELVEGPAYNTMPCYSDPDQFYDLKNDPDESNNLIDNPKYAAKINELKEELCKQLAKLPGNYNL